MGLIENLRESINFKILFILILLVIIFNKLVIAWLNSIYNELKKFINKNDEKFTNLYLNEYSENNIDRISDIFKNTKFNLGVYPNVKINEGDELFKHNKYLPECCMYYSDYSNDKGCPCITPEQQYYLQRRGFNRKNDQFIKEHDLKNIYFSPSNTFKKEKEDVFLNHRTYIKKIKPLTSECKNYVYSFFNLQDR